MPRIKLTPLQLQALLVVLPRLKEQPPPNCTALMNFAGPSRWPWSRLGPLLRRMKEKGVLIEWSGPRGSSLWKLGPVSDLLVDEGVLPS